jgi:hypothetical protein
VSFAGGAYSAAGFSAFNAVDDAHGKANAHWSTKTEQFTPARSPDSRAEERANLKKCSASHMIAGGVIRMGRHFDLGSKRSSSGMVESAGYWDAGLYGYTLCSGW